MGTMLTFDYDYQKKPYRRKNPKKPYLYLLLFFLLFCVGVYLLRNITYSPATYSLIVINIIIFILITQGKLDVYSLTTSCATTLKKREYYRIASSAFSHQEVWHILMNMMSLYNLGTVLEPFMGTRLFIIAYIIIMIVGGLLSNLVHKKFDPYVNSLGASGVLCGLLGIYLVIVVRLWGIGGLRSCAMSLIFLVGMIFTKRIDNIAHFTGLVTGVIFGILMINGIFI